MFAPQTTIRKTISGNWCCFESLCVDIQIFPLHDYVFDAIISRIFCFYRLVSKGEKLIHCLVNYFLLSTFYSLLFIHYMSLAIISHDIIIVKLLTIIGFWASIDLYI